MDIVLIKAFNEKPWRGPKTYKNIEDALISEFNVAETIIADSRKKLESSLIKYSGDENVFIFNIAEFIEDEESSSIPEILEEMNIQHLGSSCKTISHGLDKAESKKRFREAGILTPDFMVVDKITESCIKQAEIIGFPLFVKPNSGGGHIGVEDESIVNNKKQLVTILEKYLSAFHEPMLVEKYITEKNMREFSVGIIGNEDKIILPIEIDYENMNVQTKILSGSSAKNDQEKVKLISGEDKLVRDLSKMAMQAFDAVNGKDYCRVDIRMNYSGLYLLEINMMPGLGPLSFLPFAAKEIKGLDYQSLIVLLTRESIRRSIGNLKST